MKFGLAIGLLLLFTLPTQAQDITGIWRGYFYSGYGPNMQKYQYEVQINQLDSKNGPGSANPIKGVTYSYHTVTFYGKAHFVGIYNKSLKQLTLKEDTLYEVKMDALSFSCLMTSYLDYHKVDGKEVLEGNFSSITTAKGADCGSGTVYLERVQESDFKKEAFLLKKTPGNTEKKLLPIKPGAPLISETRPATAKPQTVTPPPPKPAVKQPGIVQQQAPKKPSIANSSPKKPAIPQPPAPKTDSSIVKTAPVVPPAPVTPQIQEPVKKQLPPVPDIIKQRENPLVRTITTSSPDILIELYDNGEVDGDTITVYHNNSVVALRKGLSTKPIAINIKASNDDAHHEFIMVANNLGSIPPNTALMVVKTGGKRYELFISSNEEKNAKVVIDYDPHSAGGK